MARLIVFNNVTLDGFFAGSHGDLSWAYKKRDDTEWNDFVGQNAQGGGLLLFGRKTYEMMASYWPTPSAQKEFPEVAEGMNRSHKIVFSRTLKEATWGNTRLVHGNIAEEVQKLKRESSRGIAILGSGSIVPQLTGLIDEYQIVVRPVILGKGRSMFEGIKGKIDVKLTRSRIFGNGAVLLCYERIP